MKTEYKGFKLKTKCSLAWVADNPAAARRLYEWNMNAPACGTMARCVETAAVWNEAVYGPRNKWLASCDFEKSEIETIRSWLKERADGRIRMRSFRQSGLTIGIKRDPTRPTKNCVSAELEDRKSRGSLSFLHGKNGKNGENGEDGEDGKNDSVAFYQFRSDGVCGSCRKCRNYPPGAMVHPYWNLHFRFSKCASTRGPLYSLWWGVPCLMRRYRCSRWEPVAIEAKAYRLTLPSLLWEAQDAFAAFEHVCSSAKEKS